MNSRTRFSFFLSFSQCKRYIEIEEQCAPQLITRDWRELHNNNEWCKPETIAQWSDDTLVVGLPSSSTCSKSCIDNMYETEADYEHFCYCFVPYSHWLEDLAEWDVGNVGGYRRCSGLHRGRTCLQFFAFLSRLHATYLLLGTLSFSLSTPCR